MELMSWANGQWRISLKLAQQEMKGRRDRYRK